MKIRKCYECGEKKEIYTSFENDGEQINLCLQCFENSSEWIMCGCCEEIYPSTQMYDNMLCENCAEEDDENN